MAEGGRQILLMRRTLGSMRSFCMLVKQSLLKVDSTRRMQFTSIADDVLLITVLGCPLLLSFNKCSLCFVCNFL